VNVYKNERVERLIIDNEEIRGKSMNSFDNNGASGNVIGCY